MSTQTFARCILILLGLLLITIIFAVLISLSGCQLHHIKNTESHTIKRDSVINIHHREEFDSLVERIVKGKLVKSKELGTEDVIKLLEALKSHKEGSISVPTQDGKSQIHINYHPNGKFDIDSRALDSMIKHYHSVRSKNQSDSLKTSEDEKKISKENKIEPGRFFHWLGIIVSIIIGLCILAGGIIVFLKAKSKF